MNKVELLVLGGGESGVGAALLAKKLGLQVFVSDSKLLKPIYAKELQQAGIPFEEGQHTEALFFGVKYVVKSPGIPSNIALITRLKEQGAEVISEIEFASRHTTGKIVGITGSNGKTTTTLLTHHIFKKAGWDVGLAGNVGTSFARLLAEQDHAWWILEISSFQLDDTARFRPNIGILTNITPDHLDRYEYKMENYMSSKFRITLFQTEEDCFIYCADDEWTLKGMQAQPTRAQRIPFSLNSTPTGEIGAFYQEDHIQIELIKGESMSIYELALQGKHNTYNSMASALAARSAGIHSDSVRDALADFEHIEHRLETVVQIGGVEYINDSKATNVNSTWYALESVNRKVIWIVGGVDKGNDYSQLLPLVKDKVKAIVCLGLDNHKIINEFKNDVEILTEAQSMEAAVRTAHSLAKKGDLVLLSPACASFDLFENYEDRGNQFKECVRKL